MTDRLDKLAQRVADLGLALIQAIAFIGHAARLIAQSFHLLFRGPAIGQPIRLRHVVQEIIAAGIQSLPVVILMASTIGVMLSIQGIHSLRIFGAETQVSLVSRCRSRVNSRRSSPALSSPEDRVRSWQAVSGRCG